MNRVVEVMGFEQMRKLTIARARQMDSGVRIEPEARIVFERAEDIVRCLTPHRLHIIEAARNEELPVSELATRLGRNRMAVERDARKLNRYGLVTLWPRINAGHRPVQMVKAATDQITLRL